MSFLNSPFYWRSAYSLCFLLSRVALCSGGLPVPLTMEEEPVTARARLQLPLERRDSISTCQGTTGYYACAASLGGGCCPEGLVCATDGLCSWNAAATTTSTGLVCDTEYYQCPISLGGGCCSVGEPCGSDVCNHYYMSTSTTVLLATDSLVSSPLTSTTVLTLASILAQISPSITSTSIIASSTTLTTSRYTSTVIVASAGLSPAEIGGISGGVVVFVLILTAAGLLIFRQMSRISRMLDGLDQDREQNDDSAGVNVDNKEALVDDEAAREDQRPQLGELSPQDRPRQLEDWGRHGTLRPELVGSHEAHGVTELDGVGSRVES